MKARKRYVFTGYVQGVGFRYRAYHSANLLGLTGWVCNESDGSVTMEIQGQPCDMDAMIGMIDKSPYISIEHISSKGIPSVNDERSFEILY